MATRTLGGLPALLTVEQVAQQLGISRARVYQLIRPNDDGTGPQIPSVTVGRLRRVAAADLIAYIDGLRVETTS
ncbi:helix-turn-helix domain-containing protein [Nocardioides sp. zg-1228]|uniref:helix-turn-helix domain-containing protein n=1 Tax=Nocardioides sp. zg-1228 TaxID=2763008 RepID=UPI0016424B86|nr:helix-turn-helix domain-containing protein [Nocardioides sp. zg-1228]MBC2934697.1 helix-turn-helix domain-containing protein [Nocardioides sp. zg-1228]QSF56015.1 helix-turn-helix domain-containing protein [Nocardioides sp. zg-1228]